MLGDISGRGRLEAFAAFTDSDDSAPRSPASRRGRGTVFCGVRPTIVAVLVLLCVSVLYYVIFGRAGVGSDGDGFLRQVWLGDKLSDQASAMWAEYQAQIVSHLNWEFWHGHRDVSLRVLVVNPVQNSHKALDNFVRNYQKLQNNSFGDVFHFALFFYQGSNDKFTEHDWYHDPDGPVVFASTAQTCKAEAWYLITPELAAKYDYLWLLDGDLGMDLFSWDLYRTVLVNMEPLVSQPSVVPKGLDLRSSDLEGLNMWHWETLNGMLPVYIEISRTEIMCTVVSSQLWPSFHDRLEHTDRLSAWYTSDFWDFVATLSRVDCGRPAPLLVNAAPVRHLDFHDLFHNGSRCSKHCGSDESNCRNPSGRQMELVKDNWNTSSYTCGRGDLRSIETTCAAYFRMRGCRSYLAQSVENYTMLLYNGSRASTWAFTCHASWPDALAKALCYPELIQKEV